MKFLILLFSLLTMPVSLLVSQSVGINTTTPNSSAALEVVSTNKGVLVPRMTTTQRDAITSPAEGLLIYNTTTDRFEYRKVVGATQTWEPIAPSTAGGSLTGTYPNPTIANNAVGSNQIADNAVGSSEMADNAVGSSEVANDAIGSSEIAANAVGNSEMADNAIGSNEIINGSITAADIAAGVIPSTFPPSGAASGDLSGTYPSPTIAPDAIGSPEIQNNSIQASDIAPGVIPTIPSSLPPSGAAGGDLSGAYPSPSIAPDAIGSAEITNGSLTGQDLNSMGATQGQVMTFDNGQWKPMNGSIQHIFKGQSADVAGATERKVDVPVPGIQVTVPATGTYLVLANLGGSATNGDSGLSGLVKRLIPGDAETILDFRVQAKPQTGEVLPCCMESSGWTIASLFANDIVRLDYHMGSWANPPDSSPFNVNRGKLMLVRLN